ncbi:MAG TPA: hydrogenase nickel incorporation protein HypB [Streptosporangiaceae bacterium]
MCATCGCGGAAVVRLPGPGEGGGGAPPGGAGHGEQPRHVHGAGHAGGPGHERQHGHDHAGNGHGAGLPGRTVLLQQKVLAKNDELAGHNRAWLRQRGILAVNLMSSPGSGKTTLLERTAHGLAAELTLCVIEGDQETLLDADRIRSAGCQVVQVNTGAGCHLDAAMVGEALHALDPPPRSVVIIENVGNLVCPALFDLGEAERVVLASVTEGADKPAKYPRMFRSADLVLVSKTDLLPYVDFDPGRFAGALASVSPHAQILPVSATSGDGMTAWYDWLRARTPAPAR